MLKISFAAFAIVLASTFAVAAAPDPLPVSPPPSGTPQGHAPAEKAPADPATAAAARLREAVKRIDPAAEFTDNTATFHVVQTMVILIYDVKADRMRLVSPVTQAGTVDAERLIRLLQADFDSALDARYAIAKGVLWSVFIHPLTSLTPEEFGSGLGQTVNLVRNYGTSYSSGALIFGGGDSAGELAEEQKKLIEELQKKSKDKGI